jgi:uncharacterized protein YjbI with pentapeptide repeats
LRVYLVESDVAKANLGNAHLREANLDKADFWQADLRGVVFYEASLMESNFERANLFRADLSQSNLKRTNFGGSYLQETNFREADLTGADFSGSAFGGTILGANDLREVVGLEHIKHYGPSTISNDTIQKSKGKVPLIFLRGCGLSDWEIESAKLYNPGLSNHEIDEILYKIHDLRATQPLQISPLFISYSHTDSYFVDKMEEHFNVKGIRFWRDVHHATAGRLEKQIDRAIRHNPTVLVILSENSIKSDWVEHEVRTARELEKELGRDTLCPIALDASWKDSPWPKRVMRQVMEYNILDFSKWEDDAEFEKLFKKLIDGLELFYK